MKASRRLFVAAGIVLLAGCGGDDSPSQPAPPPPPPPAAVELDFSFASGTAGWKAAYSDFSPGMEWSIDFASGHELVPPDLQETSGLFLAGDNASDDLFMYISRMVTGLRANRNYRVELEVVIATDAPPRCVGAGGAPGEGVTVKAGASSREPANIVHPEHPDLITVNFDKGNQRTGGRNAIAIGDVAKTEAGNCHDRAYRGKVLTTAGQGPIVSSDGQGRLWVVIGTDSGFEGRTKLYYLEGSATLVPL